MTPTTRSADAESNWLADVENDGRIFEPLLDGFALWPVVRAFAWQTVTGIAVGSADRRLWRRLLGQPVVLSMPFYAAWAVGQRRRLRRQRRTFLFHSTEEYRAVKRSDGWWNVYLDDIANHPDLRNQIVRSEIRASAISPLRVAAPRHLFADAQMLDMALGALFVRDTAALACADAVLDVLDQKLTDLGRPLSPDQQATLRIFMRQGARRFRRALHWYGRLLDELAPRVVVLTNAYNSHGLVAAARQRAVRVVEFQHGVISADHPGYIWPASARAVRNRLAIPDVLATYGDYWSNRLVATGFWQREETPAVGSVRMDCVRNAQRPPRSQRDKLELVFTTQYAARAWTASLLHAFIDLAGNADLAYRLTIKVHRREQQHVDVYRALARNGAPVRIMGPFDGDTLALIADADLHISAWSTCHFEAVGLGTPTVVLRSTGPNPVADLARFSNVYEAYNAEQLLDAVRVSQEALHTDRHVLERESHELFRANALENSAALLRSAANAG